MFDVGAFTTMHAALGGGGDVDVVQADAGPGDDLEVRRGGQRLGVDLGGAADQHRGRVGQGGQQGRAVGAVDVPDLDLVAEHVQDARREFLGDQDDGRDVVTGRLSRSAHPVGRRRVGARPCPRPPVPTSWPIESRHSRRRRRRP